MCKEQDAVQTLQDHNECHVWSQSDVQARQTSTPTRPESDVLVTVDGVFPARWIDNREKMWAVDFLGLTHCGKRSRPDQHCGIESLSIFL